MFTLCSLVGPISILLANLKSCFYFLFLELLPVIFACYCSGENTFLGLQAFQPCLGNVLLLRAPVVAVTSVLTGGPALQKIFTG